MRTMIHNLLLFPILFLVPLIGLYLAQAAIHGFEPVYWPAETMGYWILRPNFSPWRFPDISPTVAGIADFGRFFLAMALGRNPVFPGGGTSQFWAIIASLMSAFVLWFLSIPSTVDDNRRVDRTGQFGKARWATVNEQRRLVRGIEVGVDRRSRSSVRLRVEGNLLSIAPPRTGKTSAFIINNLLVPDKKAWDGPALIIDPKGEVYHAVEKRRRSFDRAVHCLDLRANPADDQWNPLANVGLDNVLYLQRAALALLPSMKNENAYFRERGSMFLAATIAAAVLDARAEERMPVPADVERLLNDREDWGNWLRNTPIFRSCEVCEAIWRSTSGR